MATQQHTAAIIGGGIMGGDVAIVFAAGGWNVHVMSPSQNTRDALPARVAAGLSKLAAPASHAARNLFVTSVPAAPPAPHAPARSTPRTRPRAPAPPSGPPGRRGTR